MNHDHSPRQVREIPISRPTQLDAIRRWAEELGVDIVREFADSGTAAPQRRDCPECGGTGVYIGLADRGSCRACGGTGAA
jgi:hypothetical protein